MAHAIDASFAMGTLLEAPTGATTQRMLLITANSSPAELLRAASIAYGYPPLWRAPWRTPVERADWLAHNTADPCVASTRDFINNPSAWRGVDAYDEFERIFA